MPSTESRYHHGDLRRAALAATAEMVTEVGPAAFSLRQLARRIGVTHTSIAHHFGDKQGLFTALATEGFELLADELGPNRSDFLELGVAYVRFATSHPGHFEVMFQPDLHDRTDAALVAARSNTSAMLHSGAARLGRDERDADVALAGWALVHGLASLWLSGNISGATSDPASLTRRIAVLLGAGGVRGT